MAANIPKPQAPEDNGLEEKIQRAVLNALGSLNLAGGVGYLNTSEGVVSGPEEPLYIPSNIVNKEIEGTLTVKNESSSSENLDDAASALKKLRKSKKEK